MKVQRENRGVTGAYSVIQGFFWMSFAAVMGFSSVYLLGCGLTSSQVGLVLAVSGIYHSAGVGRICRSAQGSFFEMDCADFVWACVSDVCASFRSIPKVGTSDGGFLWMLRGIFAAFDAFYQLFGNRGDQPGDSA